MQVVVVQADLLIQQVLRFQELIYPFRSVVAELVELQPDLLAMKAQMEVIHKCLGVA